MFDTAIEERVNLAPNQLQKHRVLSSTSEEEQCTE
jgi:hypothetical protein